jgi:hypothetical protein
MSMKRIHLVLLLMLGIFASGTIKVAPAQALPIAPVADSLLAGETKLAIQKTQYWGGYYRPRYRYYRPRYYRPYRYYRPHRYYRQRFYRRW